MSDVVDPKQFGVSFSAKQCRNFGVSVHDCLFWLNKEAGFRRFRLMSYWNETEKEQGVYSFEELDMQLEIITAFSGQVTLCLGVKQPRWPEYHWPKWAKNLSEDDKAKALLLFVEKVVRRYKDNPTISSWQLENEALLKGFGESIHIDRARLRAEFALVKKLDATRPIIMSTSNGWGLPARRPIPDSIGFSYYPIMYKNGRYNRTIQKPWLHRMRKHLAHMLLRKKVFIHELQLEPWGHTAIWKMTTDEQNMSMNNRQIAKNIKEAKRINAYPVDLWGAEWWYWRNVKQDDPSIWHAVKNAIET
jgi:hypothetical protein